MMKCSLNQNKLGLTMHCVFGPEKVKGVTMAFLEQGPNLGSQLDRVSVANFSTPTKPN